MKLWQHHHHFDCMGLQDKTPANIAGILCAAIISDTMYFKSPTSTGKDKYMAEKMAEVAGLDLEDFSKNA